MYSIEQKHFEICVDVCNSVEISTVDTNRFFRTLDGVAVLALLVNAAAKARGEDPKCYSAKTALVDLLIDHLPSPKPGRGMTPSGRAGCCTLN